ncbi:ATP-binding cassette domain-containing protein, partial [Ralstonia pseudosolanacearum]|uniref:ATP-binding cassette domain-containing protein n=1 Tax=Ralstonia pseudosolanacearum TaxID=1310165 RepID=UPI003CEB7E33
MNAPSMPPAPTLSTHGLSKRWGGFHANADISLTFAPGARHALIGPNGAGKTTFINLLTGAFAPTAGQVRLDGDDITRLSAHQRVKRGITRTFQINTLFPGLTVLESVMLAIERHQRGMAAGADGLALEAGEQIQ